MKTYEKMVEEILIEEFDKRIEKVKKIIKGVIKNMKDANGTIVKSKRFLNEYEEALVCIKESFEKFLEDDDWQTCIENIEQYK